MEWLARERVERRRAVVPSRGSENTMNILKRILGVVFKKRDPLGLKEIMEICHAGDGNSRCAR